MLRAQARLDRITRLRPVGALDGERVQRHGDLARGAQLVAVREAGVDQRVQHYPAGIGLVRDARHLPVFSESGELSRVIRAAENIHEPAQSLERARRSLEALRGEARRSEPVTRREAGIQHPRHAAEHLDQAGRLRSSQSQGIYKLGCC